MGHHVSNVYFPRVPLQKRFSSCNTPAAAGAVILEMATTIDHFGVNKIDHAGHNVPVVGTDLCFQSVTGISSSFVGMWDWETRYESPSREKIRT